jgi:hypothetical protein
VARRLASARLSTADVLPPSTSGRHPDPRAGTKTRSGLGCPSCTLSRLLSCGKLWTHDYPITVEQARELGLSVSTNVPEDIYRFMSLFPQRRAQRPSVEYVPILYTPRERSEPHRAATSTG